MSRIGSFFKKAASTVRSAVSKVGQVARSTFNFARNETKSVFSSSKNAAEQQAKREQTYAETFKRAPRDKLSAPLVPTLIKWDDAPARVFARAEQLEEFGFTYDDTINTDLYDDLINYYDDVIPDIIDEKYEQLDRARKNFWEDKVEALEDDIEYLKSQRSGIKRLF